MAEIVLKHVQKVYPNNESKKKGFFGKKKKTEEKKHNLKVTEDGVLAVEDFNLTVHDQEFVVLVGPSGCGKSTTMRMVAGLEDITSGDVLIDGKRVNDVAPKDRDIAMVFQSYALYPNMTVYENMAFTLELKKVPKDEIDRKVRSAAEILGITEYLDRKPKALSGGQRQRLALAGVLAMHPGLLLLDEPTANLDPEGVKEVHDAVRHVLEQTRETLVVVEHHIDVWLDLVDRVIVLGKPEADSHVSGVIADGTPEEVFGSMASVLAKGGAWVPGRTIESHTPESSQSSGDVVLRTEDLSFGRDFALGEHVNLVFHAGEITALTGKNGVGKSTLALTLAGLLKPISGRVSMDETMVPARRENDVFTWKSRDLLGRIGMVFQEPEHQFVASSVRDEAAVGPKSMGKSEEESYAIADNMLERMNLARFAQANPFTLSGGEKRRLSVASMLAAAPKVLVMDEPTFGQDFTTWTEMVKLIAGARDAGCSVIMVTHDEPLIETLGARRVLVSEGE